MISHHITKSLLLFFIVFQLDSCFCQKPIFSNAPDKLDFKGTDYYDELKFPGIKNEKIHYIRGSEGGLSTVRPVVKPKTPPDVEPINNLKTEGNLIKIGRIQGKTLWNEKTKNIKVQRRSFDVKSEGLGRTAKGLVIDMTNVKHNGYRVRMAVNGLNYEVTVESDRPMTGTAKVQFYVNPPWKKLSDGKKKKEKLKGKEKNKDKGNKKAKKQRKEKEST